jgi:hypothetical protein
MSSNLSPTWPSYPLQAATCISQQAGNHPAQLPRPVFPPGALVHERVQTGKQLLWVHPPGDRCSQL